MSHDDNHNADFNPASAVPDQPTAQTAHANPNSSMTIPRPNTQPLPKRFTLKYFEKPLTLLFSALAIVVSLFVAWWTNSIALKQAELSRIQTEYAGKQTSIADVSANQGNSNTLMGVLDLVSRVSSEFGGLATAYPPGSQSPVNMSSEEAIKGSFREEVKQSIVDGATVVTIPYSGDTTHPRVAEFQLRSLPITSLIGVSEALANEKAFENMRDKNNKPVDLTQSYLLPMIAPKIQSDDPTIAASALIVVASLLKNTADRSNPFLKDLCNRGNFSCVRFNWPKLDLSNFDFGNAQFGGARITSAKFNSCNLTGANFHGASLTDVEMKGAVASDINLTAVPAEVQSSAHLKLYYENNKRVLTPFTSVSFERCNFGLDAGKRTNMTGCVFSGSKFRDCKIEQTDFPYSLFLDVECAPKQEFKECDFSHASIQSRSIVENTFAGCTFNRASFFHGPLTKSKFLGIEGKRSEIKNAMFVGVNLSGSLFEDCDLTAAKFLSKRSDPKAPEIGEMGGVTFSKVNAAQMQVDATISDQLTFTSTDLTGADFSRVDATDFDRISFKDVVADWMRIPYSQTLAGNLKQRERAKLRIVPGNLKLQQDGGVIILVEKLGTEFRYKGAVTFNPKEADTFILNESDDNGRTVLTYVKQGGPILNKAGLHVNELQQFVKDKTVNENVTPSIDSQSDWLTAFATIGKEQIDESLKGYISLKWGFAFPPFNDPPAPK